jgi:hypothetical protein
MEAAMFVVTADQRNSRRGPDRVPAMLAELAERPGADPHRLPFERTAGDEIQGLLSDPAAVVDVVVTLLRGGWWVGIGVGGVDEPTPESARAGRGPAYVAAREAVDSAKGAAAGICVVGGAGIDGAEQAEAAAWLLATLLARRTPQGWQVVDLVAAGAKGIDAARKLDISPQAVSSRLRVAGWTEELRGRELLTWLLERADRPLV